MSLRYKSAYMLSLSTLLLMLVAGCAAHSSRTVTTERVEYSDDRRVAAPVVARTSTETTSTTETETEPGVMSGTVNAVGEVLALPFRAVGGLIRVIF